MLWCLVPVDLAVDWARLSGAPHRGSTWKVSGEFGNRVNNLELFSPLTTVWFTGYSFFSFLSWPTLTLFVRLCCTGFSVGSVQKGWPLVTRVIDGPCVPMILLSVNWDTINHHCYSAHLAVVPVYWCTNKETILGPRVICNAKAHPLFPRSNSMPCERILHLLSHLTWHRR